MAEYVITEYDEDDDEWELVVDEDEDVAGEILKRLESGSEGGGNTGEKPRENTGEK